MKTRPASDRDRKAAVGLTLAAATILADSVQPATSRAASDDGWRTALTIRSKALNRLHDPGGGATRCRPDPATGHRGCAHSGSAAKR